MQDQVPATNHLHPKLTLKANKKDAGRGAAVGRTKGQARVIHIVLMPTHAYVEARWLLRGSQPMWLRLLRPKVP